jgi:hypothetical protein
MTKKQLKTTILSLGFLFISFFIVHAQDENNEKLTRPGRCDVSEVDSYVNKCFDAYEESQKITEAVNFFKVEGEGDSKVILNPKGEHISKTDALFQLGELMVRAKKQNDNIQSIQDLQKPATESIKKAPIAKKPQATKNLNKGNEALTELMKETKKQIEQIDRQITEIKEIND